MNKTMEPAPLAATRYSSVEEETPKSQLIREWIGAMNENETKRDMGAAITLYCVRCKDFNINEVVNCKINGCALWWCRTNKLDIND